jgi:hypothetical protein
MARAPRVGLPDMSYIRRKIPIVDVATSLGIRVAGRNAAHCWRAGAHQNGDRTPSMSFHRNRAKCHVCDADAMSVIDLVIKYRECSLHEATDWICAHWTVPTIAKNQKLWRPERWKTSRVGASAFPLEELIRSGVWATLDDAARAVLPVLFCFAENGEVSISYRGLARYSSKTSHTTIAKVLRHFQQIGLLKALPKTHGNFREVRRYRFTLESPEFQTLLLDVHEHLKAERDLERKLRPELKEATPTPTPTPTPHHTQVLLCPLRWTVGKVHATPRWTVHLKSPKIPAFHKHQFKRDAALKISNLGDSTVQRSGPWKWRTGSRPSHLPHDGEIRREEGRGRPVVLGKVGARS